MVNIPYLWCYERNGKTLCYYRRNGKTFRIRDAAGNAVAPADPGFGAAYDAVHARFSGAPPARDQPARHSLAALIVAFKERPKWVDLAPLTRESYARSFALLEAKWGKAHVPALDRPRVLEVHKALLHDANGVRVPARANAGIKALNLLVAYSIDLGWRRDNPAKNVERFRMGDGFTMWQDEDFRRFVDSDDVGDHLKRAVVLAYYTGLRVSDLIAVPKTARAGGVITVTPQKTKHSTKAVAVIDEHPELTKWLSSAPTHFAQTLLADPRGLPWTRRTITREMTNAVRKLGLAGLSFHGLRKGLTGALAESGATDAEIEAVVPHSAAMTRFYRAQANQKRLASAAITKLSDRRR